MCVENARVFITSMSRIFGHESLFTFIEKDINVLNKLTSPSQFFCSTESNYSPLYFLKIYWRVYITNPFQR